MKKPGIPSYPINDRATQQMVYAIKENIEILTGSRSGVTPIAALPTTASTTEMIDKINELINRLNYNGD